jgi:FAD/FMN-containing dehydrogenase
MTFVDELQTWWKGDIAFDEKTLAAYSHDASLLEVRPTHVLYPKDAEDVAKLVAYVHEKKVHAALGDDVSHLSITARSAGTCMSGGAINESIIIDFTRYMAGVERIENFGSDTQRTMHTKALGTAVTIAGQAVALPGTFYRDFEAKTLKKGLLLPCYTASKSINAIGGMVGNNSGGEKTLAYGKTEDYARELEVVFSDGKCYTVKPLDRAGLDAKMAQNDFEGSLYRGVFDMVTKNDKLLQDAKPKVSKNSAGYYLWNVWDGKTFDLGKLIVGSQGTLGIVTKATLDLVKVKNYSKLYVIFLKDLAPVSALVNEILPFGPESVESYDDNTFKLAIRFLPSMIRAMKVSFLKLAWSFWHEAFMALRLGRLPKLIVLVEFAGESEAEVEAKAQALHRHLAEYLKTHGKEIHLRHLDDRVTTSETESEKYWTIRRESFNLLRQHVHDRRTAPFIDDVIVRPEHLPKFLPEANAIINAYPNMVYTIAGHVGDGNFHIIPLMDMHDPRSVDTIMRCSEEIYDLVARYGGSITAEHNDGIIRTPFLPKIFSPEVIELFENTKKLFDPLGIFNPGKKVGGTKRYIRSHIVKG